MQPENVTVMARLEVPLAIFVEELKRSAQVLGRRSSGDALLTFGDGQLRVRMGGTEFAVPAVGRWPGEPRASSSWVRALAKIPPSQDPLVFQVHQDRLRIAGSSIPCKWQRNGLASLEVPLGLELLDLLRLGVSHPQEELENSGIFSAVKQARKELDKRISAAARLLAPFGITAAEIRRIVDDQLALPRP